VEVVVAPFAIFPRTFILTSGLNNRLSKRVTVHGRT